MTKTSLTRLQECAGSLLAKQSHWPCTYPLAMQLTRRQGFPQAMPFSQTYPMCCINIRNFVDQFYQFTDGVAQQHLDIDEVLRKVSRLICTVT